MTTDWCLPPKIAPIQVVIVPIWRGDDPRGRNREGGRRGPTAARGPRPRRGAGRSGRHDARSQVPRVGTGRRPAADRAGSQDLAKQSVVCVKRVGRKKSFVPLDQLEPSVTALLDEIQGEMLTDARARRDAATTNVDDYDAFKKHVEGPGGFLLAHWCGDGACEERVQQETKATIRCLAFDQPEETGRCMVCGGASPKRAHFAKAY